MVARRGWWTGVVVAVCLSALSVGGFSGFAGLGAGGTGAASAASASPAAPVTAANGTAGLPLTSTPATGLVAGSVSPTTPSIDLGQSVLLTSNALGGSPPYSYQWYSGSSPVCANDTAVGGGNGATLSPSPSTATYYCYVVTDSSLASSTSATDLVTVHGALVAGTVAPNVPTLDRGQTAVFSASPASGSPPYTYQWYEGNSGSCATDTPIGTNSSTVSISPTASTYVCYIVTDSSPGLPTASGTSNLDLVVVDPALSAGAISPANPVIDRDQAVTLTSSPSGGTPTYTFQWYTGSSATCSGDSKVLGANQSTYAPSPSASAYYCYAVSDSSTFGATVDSATDYVTVNETLAAGSVSPTSPTIDADTSLLLSANPVGGVPPYAYQWYVGTSLACQLDTEIPGAVSPTFTAAPTATSYYCYSLRDSSTGGATVYSPADQVTVNSVLAARAPQPFDPDIDPGQSVTFTAEPVNGTAPYFYQWYSGTVNSCAADTAVPGATNATYTVSPSVNTYYCYRVADSAVGTPASVDYSVPTYVTIDTTLTAGAVQPASPTIDDGQTVSLTAYPSGGTPPYGFQWYDGSDPNCTGDSAIAHETSSTLTAEPSANSYYCYRLTDSSPGAPSSGAWSPTDLITVNPTLSAGSVEPLSPTIDVGQSIQLTAYPSGGTAPYQVAWSGGTSSSCGLDTPLGETGLTITVAPTTTTYYCYVLTDGSTNSPIVPSIADLVSVNGRLVAGPPAPGHPSIDLGQSVTLAANLSGGWAPFSFQWYSGSEPGCANGTAITDAHAEDYIASPTTSTYYCYTVTDSSTGVPAADATSVTDLVTVNSPLEAGAITPGSPIVDAGQPVTLVSDPSGGTPLYGYQWYEGGSASTCTNEIVGANASTYTAYPTADTFYCYTVRDSSSGGPAQSPSSVSDLVTVQPALTAGAVSPNLPTIDDGQTVELHAAGGGGLLPYSYQWYAGSSLSCTGNTAIAGATYATYNASPSATTYYCYAVTDASLNAPTIRSAVDTVHVNAVLSPGSVSPDSPLIDPGQSVLLTANPYGGTPSYTYQWYGGTSLSCPSETEIAGANAASYSAEPLSSPYYYCVEISDASTDAPTVWSGPDEVTVGSVLVAGSPTPNGATIDLNQTILLGASASGGTPAYHFQWYSGPSATCASDTAIAGAVGASYVASPTVSAYYCFNVTDSSPGVPLASALSPTIYLTVDPALKGGSVSPGSPGIDLGQSVTLTANPSGGTAPYSYQWYSGSSSVCSSDSAIGGATSVTLTVDPTATVYYCYVVADNSTNAPSVRSVADKVTVNPALSGGDPTPSTPTIDAGQTVALTGAPVGGTAPYHYQWYGGSSSSCSGDTLIVGATSSTYRATPGGPTDYCYVVTDSAAGTPAQNALSATADVTIAPTIFANPILPSSPTISGGQSITLSANATGGVPGYHYQWYVGASTDCADDTPIAGATGAMYTGVPTGTSYYCYNVTDSSPGTPPVNASSAANLVTVTLGAGPALPASPALDAGQSLTLSASPIGGIAPYSYQWYSGSSSVCSSDTAIAGATHATLTIHPAVGTTDYCYVVTDSSDPPATETSATDLVTVHSGLSASPPTPAAPIVDSGSSVTLHASPSGGTPPYAFQWYGGVSSTCTADGLLSGQTHASLTVSPVVPTYYCYLVTDNSTGSPVASNLSATVGVEVGPTLYALEPSASVTELDAGQSVTLTAEPEGGTAPYFYQWYTGAYAACSEDTAISGATSSTLATQPTASAYYCYVVTDSSSSPPAVPSTGAYITVEPALVPGAPRPASSEIDSGQTVIVTAEPTGGVGPYALQWYAGTSATCADDSLVTGQTETTYSASLKASTYFCYTLGDATGALTTSPTVEVVVNAALAAGALSPTTPPIDTGQSIVLTANPTGGTAPFSYEWFDGTSSTCSKDALIVGADAATITVAPTANTYYCVTVADSSAGTPAATSTSGTDEVTINAALKVGSLTPNFPSVTKGGSITLDANVTQGTAPYTYQWFSGNSSTCSDDTAIAGATSATLTVSPTVNTYYCYQANDSSKATVPGSALSPTTEVTITTPAPTFLGLPAVEGYAVLGVLIAIIALIALAIVLRRRRSRKGAGSDYL